LDFDPAELEKLAREGLPSDGEEEEEDDEYNVRLSPSLPLSLSLSLSLSLPISLSHSFSLSPPLSFSCNDELWQWFLTSPVASASNGRTHWSAGGEKHENTFTAD
jgi:hypothetical protein